MCFDVMRKSLALIAGTAIVCATIAASQSSAQSVPLDQIKLPPGFSIELVGRVPNARAMTWAFGASSSAWSEW